MNLQEYDDKKALVAKTKKNLDIEASDKEDFEKQPFYFENGNFIFNIFFIIFMSCNNEFSILLAEQKFI